MSFIEPCADQAGGRRLISKDHARLAISKMIDYFKD